MPLNVFDKASRFAVKIDPQAFFSWAVRLPAERLVFRGWLDTRSVPDSAKLRESGLDICRCCEAKTGMGKSVGGLERDRI